MPLTVVSQGSLVKVKRIGGSAAVKQHLNELGFNVGTEVTVVSVLDGSLIVKVKESRIALDSNLAGKIFCA
ncbi:ferrous iron transport protein A [Treponema parvum]|uniref:Ferrous iron transport protein A n=1 Tax=Treponema parvum TaxID=138851 RepID=A0A975EYZ1_9SPIR|nr:FeoA family protein [Treponema parvum]QTQ11378.1 ferrous iron transport protein A [Treponema parvum]QTQ14445.1 ferrous iron transport protein A [Treponema parvum]QTQ16680.1 ferrous iron transport protein A [Treponema parvum]